MADKHESFVIFNLDTGETIERFTGTLYQCYVHVEALTNGLAEIHPHIRLSFRYA